MNRRALLGTLASVVAVPPAFAALIPTPPQTMGPFYPRVKPIDSDADLTLVKGARGPAQGQVIEVLGRVLSAKGGPVAGATVEIWQADVGGRYNHPWDRGRADRDPNFQGYGAVRAGQDGDYRFRTIRPRYYDTGVGLRTPHIHFRVVAPNGGELATQMYFPGEPMNQRDFIYQGLGSDAQREAATARSEQNSPTRFLFDIVLA